MSSFSLDVRLFRYAVASAEHGSFRRAAAALNIQQSTVSRGVRSLEHRIGAELFERDHAGIRPTPAGERFLQEASLGFDHLERAVQRIAAVKRGEYGELTVATSVPFLLLGEVFEDFSGANPGVSLEIVEGTCSASVMLVQQRKADVGFVVKTPTDGAVQSLYLSDEPMIAVLPTAHRLARERVLMLEDLRPERFILGVGGLGPEVARYLELQMAKSGGEPNLKLHRISQCDLMNMVARGFGITVVIGPLPHVGPEGVVFIPIAGSNTLPIHAVWLESNANPALKALSKTLLRAGSKRPGDGRSAARKEVPRSA